MTREWLKFTRDQYMARECTHDEYNDQFVTESLKDFVRTVVGAKRIAASEWPFYDIPLARWDSMSGTVNLLVGDRIQAAQGYGVSLSDTVCAAKAAARHIQLEEVKSND